MKRIFAVIAVVSIVMIVSASGGMYGFSSLGANNAKREAAAAVANNLAINLAQQLDMLQKTVDGLAQSADVILALNSGNPELIKATAAKLQTAIPYNLRLRLLLPNVGDVDDTQLPHMGFGDLDMVRATLTGAPQPVIQGDAQDRHLAVTSAVRSDQQVIGVVLASLDADLPKQLVLKNRITGGLIELKQDKLVLASAGSAGNKEDEPLSIPVINSRWTIDAWAHIEPSLGDIGILAALIIIPSLLSSLAFFIGYRKLHDFFRQDQSSILKAAKDMLQGKHVGNYPMQLEEMQPIIAAMVQFKRVISQGGMPVVRDDKSNGHDFFEESFGIDLIEDIASGAEPIQSAPVSVPQSPLSTAAERQSIVEPAEQVPSAPIPESWDMDVKKELAKAFVSASKPVPALNIFHEHDISGVVGKSLNEDIVGNIGRAFASEAKQLEVKTIVVARDGRLSSLVLTEALIKGIVSTGCDVLNLGLVPTPVLCFVAHHTEGRTGIMVTGGDLPGDHNGLNMVLHDQALSKEQLQSLRARISSGDYHQEPAGSVELNALFSNEYIGIISEDVHIIRPMSVVVDCANGACGQLGPTLLRTIGCDVVELDCDIDGQFPGQCPDPCDPVRLKALGKSVKLNNAELGIAFNGDGDRMGLVDSDGKIIWPDRLMMLFARDLLARKIGAEIIYDAACSKHLPEQIQKRGGHPVLWNSGRSYLQAHLRETGAAMAADMEGHFLFNDRWFGFTDGLYAAVRIIGILSADMRASSEVFGELPDSPCTPELQVPMAEGESAGFIHQLLSQAQFNNVYTVKPDGMRAEFSDGWGLVRASTTRPALVLRFEADSETAMKRIQSEFKALMLKIKPDLSLPF